MSNTNRETRGRGDAETRRPEASRRVPVSPRPRVWLLAFLLLPFAFAGCRNDMHDQPRYKPYRPSEFFADGMSSRPLVEGTVARGLLREDRYFYTGQMTGAGGQAAGGAQAGQQGMSGAQQQAGGGNTQAGQPQAGGGQPTGGDPNIRIESGAGVVGATQGGQTPEVRGLPGAQQAAAGGGDFFPFPITREDLRRGQERYRIFCAMCHGELGDGDGMIVRRGFRQPPTLHEERLRAATVGHFFDVISNGWGAMPRYDTMIPARDRWVIIAYIRALQLSQSTMVQELTPEERARIGQQAARPNGQAGQRGGQQQH